MNFDPPAQYQVAPGPQGDEERTENDEVDVEVSVLDVQFTQDIIRLREHTLLNIFVTTVERLTVKPVDRL